MSKRTKKTNGVSALCLLALSKYNQLKSDPLLRDDVEPGTYEVDEVVRVHGTVKVLEDGPRADRLTVPWAKLVEAACKRRGVTFEGLVAEALADDGDGEEMKGAVEALVRKLDPPARPVKPGNVSVVVLVDKADA